MAEHTRDEFFIELQKIGVTPHMAVDILRRNGVQGKYTPEKHDEYMKMIGDYQKCLTRLMDTVNKIESKYYYLDKCPVCGFPVERDSSRDGSLGEQKAWKCMNPEQGEVSHFVWHRLEMIRPWMQRNQGMSDPVTSSEMENQETVYPNGESQKETSSVDSLE